MNVIHTTHLFSYLAEVASNTNRSSLKMVEVRGGFKIIILLSKYLF